MVHSCFVCKRSASKDSKDQKTSFHRFPSAIDRRKIWLNALNVSEMDLPYEPRICSDHFASDLMFEVRKGKKYLQPRAVPHLKLHSESSSETASASDLESTLTASEIEQYLQSSESQPASPRSIVDLSVTPYDVTARDPLLESSDSDSSPIMIRPSFPERKKRKYFFGNIELEGCSIPTKFKKYFNPTKTTVMKQRMQSLNKKVNILKRKVISVQTLLRVLREKYNISEIAEQSLEASIPENAKQIFLRMLQGRTKSKHNPALRPFALTLNFYSPRAYVCVRENFSKTLPHPSVLSEWHQTEDGSPGFLKDCLNALRLKVEEAESSNRQVFCNLVLDEMPIRSHIEWTGSKFTGYIDVGAHIDSDKLPEAKEALVFMVVALNSYWKVPVAYFLIDGIGGAEKANLVLKVIEFVHDSGVVVTSVSFDGAVTNFAMARCLGGNFGNPNSLQTSFSHPVTKKPVYLFPDPCHMMKLVKNCIASQPELQDENGDSIKWEFVENLVHLQNKAGAKLATQTLSKSLADALNAMQASGNRSFQGVGPTSKFILRFNNIFDILNSRNRLCKYRYQRPLSYSNYLTTFNYLNKAKEYIMSIRLKGSSVLTSQRKTGFLGFLICIESLKEMFSSYVDRDNFKYLFTYKLSQDHLQLFFGTIRSLGVVKYNPTARQFEAALKRLIAENAAIFHCTGRSPTTTAEGDDGSSNFERLLDNVLKQVSQHNFVSPSWDLSDCTEDVVNYFAGFVVKILKKTVTCVKCFDLLEGRTTQKGHKNSTQASLLVMNVCRCGDKCFRFYYKINNVVDKNVLIAGTLKTIPDSVCDLFGDHVFDELGNENHFIRLSKLILKIYFQLRMHHETCKKTEAANRIRSSFTDRILFRK